MKSLRQSRIMDASGYCRRKCYCRNGNGNVTEAEEAINRQEQVPNGRNTSDGGGRDNTAPISQHHKLLDLIPAALAVGVYSNSLDGDFVHDDLSAITGNRDVTGDPTSPTGTWDFLYNDFWGTSLLDPHSHKSYRPLTILTFKLNYAASGLNPWSYHAVNVILHAVVSWLLAWTCRHCLNTSNAVALAAATLFAIHPVHTEAVSGIVGRADLLSTLFFLISFIAHDRATSSLRRPSTAIILRGTSLLAALMALAAKENGIAALPVIIAWDVVRLQTDTKGQHGPTRSPPATKTRVRKTWRHWIGAHWLVSGGPILVSFVTTLGLLALRIGLQRGQLPLFSEQDNPAAFASDRKARIFTLFYLPAFNMGLLLSPVRLSYDWQNGSIPLVTAWSDCRNLLSLLFYTSLAVAFIWSWLNRRRVVLWSVAVMVLPMLPASNLFYPCGFVVAERLLYLPSLGYCLIVALGLQKVLCSVRNGSRRMRPSGPARRSVILIVASVAFLSAAMVVKTWTRNADWTDRKTLFESGLRTLPHNAKMHYNYANLQKDDGHWDAAIDHYRRAIELWPDYASALNNLGTVLLASGIEDVWNERVMEAERRFREAIRSHPHHVHAHYNLAVLSLQRNETERAIGLLRRCLLLKPDYAEANRLLERISDQAVASTQNRIGPISAEDAIERSSANIRQPVTTEKRSPSVSTVDHWIDASRLPPTEQDEHLHPTPSTAKHRWNKTSIH